MNIFLRRTDRGMIPLTDKDKEMLQRIPIGADVKCSVTMPRNIMFHRKFFAILGLVFDNMPERLVKLHNITSIESLLDHIKLDLGEFEFHEVDGNRLVRLKSISFSSMDQQQFEEFVNRAVDIITAKYLPGVTREQLLNEVPL